MRRYSLRRTLAPVPGVLDLARPALVACAILAAVTGDLRFLGLALAIRWARY